MNYKDKEKLIELLTSGYTVKNIAEMYSISNDMIRYYIRKHEIDRNIITNPKRKYFFNEAYFESIDTKNKAYVLGLFASDGYLKDDRTICFQFHEKDIELLHIIAKEVKYSFDFKHIVNKNQYNLSLHSKKMYADLQRLGFQNNKTFNTVIPEVLNRLYWKDFLRGMMDGDGHIGKKRCAFTTASDKLVYQILQYFKEELGKDIWHKKYNKTNQLQFYKKNIDALFLLYDESELYLKRKKDNLYTYWKCSELKE